MKEIWKDIDDYNGRYQVSNIGNVKSLIQDKVDGKILKPILNHKGYPTIGLRCDNKQKFISIHRLVAMAFIENPNNYPQVNHKDEIKTNNNVDNLEWCTNEYNMRYGTRTERARQSNMCCETTSLKVYSIDEYGNKEEYDSIGEAERQTGLSHCNIVATLKGRRHTCGNKK